MEIIFCIGCIHFSYALPKSTVNASTLLTVCRGSDNFNVAELIELGVDHNKPGILECENVKSETDLPS